MNAGFWLGLLFWLWSILNHEEETSPACLLRRYYGNHDDDDDDRNDDDDDNDKNDNDDDDDGTVFKDEQMSRSYEGQFFKWTIIAKICFLPISLAKEFNSLLQVWPSRWKLCWLRILSFTALTQSMTSVLSTRALSFQP